MADFIGLHQLKKGEQMVINGIIDNQHFGELDYLVSQRLADLGFSNGMSITVIAKGFLNRGPVAVRLSNGSQFSLRMAEAMKITGYC